ncbi:hypothetical protein SEA_RADFAD_42 [Arthrobacter phage RadFad]|nr:hypothetical protein SEA_RADFAD_42 [Arthrobacter phage RadFad]
MNIPDEAMAAASFAMREVTPPPGVDRVDWLKEHGPFALLAGAVAAAAPYLMAQALHSAADAIEEDPYDDLDPFYAGWLRDRVRKMQEGSA